MAEAINIPQPGAAAAPGSDAAIGVNEIPVDGIENLDGVNVPSDGGDPIAETTKPSDPETLARSFQGRYDRLNATVGPQLREYIEKVGSGNNAATLLSQYEKALNHPELGNAIRNFMQTGQVSLPTARGAEPEEEDYRDPLEVKFETQLAEMRQMVSGLQGQLSTQAASRGVEMVGTYTSSFLDEYPMTVEQKDEFQERLDARMAAMTSQHGAHLLENMTRDGFDAMALPLIKPFLVDIVTRQQNTKKSSLQAMATDAPAVAPTNVAAERHTQPGNPAHFRSVQERARAAARRAFQGQ